MRQNIFTFLALSWLLVGATGCISRIAAGRIVAAPNQTPSSLNKKLAKFSNWTELQKKFSPNETNKPFAFATIRVGPPDAKLKAVVFPPQDYRLKITSKYWENTNHYGMSFGFFPATNLFTPLKEPATIVILHGYSMTKESMAPWAFTLAQAGYRVVLVDLRGHGQSTGWQVSFGKYETTDLSQMVDYLVAQNLCDERIGVLGLSYGATLALHWAAHDPRVRTAVAIAPYNQPDHAMARFAKEFKTPLSQETMREAMVIASAKLKLSWTNWSGENAVRQLKEPVLLIGAKRDTICPPADIEMLQQLAPAGSKCIQISKPSHMVLGYWFHELEEPITAWFHEHLGQTPKSKTDERLLISKKSRDGNSTSQSIQPSPK